MGWEYKITKSSLGYNVYRKQEKDGIMRLEWLQNGTYTLNRDYAKTFYHLGDAESALVTARFRGEKTPTTSTKKSESEGIKEKRSWSEF